MAVSDQTPSITHTANGLTGTFAYNFRILDEADIQVLQDGVAATLDVDYTVTGVDADGGGNVVFAVNPVADTEIVLRRNMVYKRDIDYQNAGDFKAGTVNADFDAAVMMVQQLAEEASRAPKLAAGSAVTEVEIQAPVALQFLRWNASGDGLESAEVDVDAVNEAAASAAADAATATAQAAIATEKAVEASASVAAAESARDDAEAARDETIAAVLSVVDQAATGNLEMEEVGNYTALRINGVSMRRTYDMRGYYAERPTGFDWDIGHWVRLGMTGSLESSLDPTDYDVAGAAPGVVYLFVDPATGSDSAGNNGHSAASPLLSLNGAISRILTDGDANAVIYAKPVRYADAKTWGTSQIITSNVSIKPWSGATSAPYDDTTGAPIIISTETTGLVWSATGSGAYSSTRSTVCAVADEAVTEGSGLPSLYDKAASLAACDATPGTWFQSGSTIYVHTLDNRAPDADVHVYVKKNAARTGEGNFTFYAKNVWFYGGAHAFYGSTSNAATTEVLCFDRCRFFYGAANGQSNYGSKYVINYLCESAFNCSDGFNYHGDTTDATKITYNLEFGCVAHDNGYTWSAIQDVNNGSTTHDGCYIARFGTVCYRNQGPNVADVGGGKSWLFACQSRESEPVTVDNSSADFYFSANTAWLDHCDAEGSNYATVSTGGAAIYARRCNLYPRMYTVTAVQAW